MECDLGASAGQQWVDEVTVLSAPGSVMSVPGGVGMPHFRKCWLDWRGALDDLKGHRTTGGVRF